MLQDKFWKRYWSDRKTPMHARDDERGYELYGREANLLMDSLGYTPGPSLEIGCGNGALFDYFNFIDSKTYTGIDFSESLISGFKEKHPDLDVHVSDLLTFDPNKKFNLIFSHGVLQYLNKTALQANIAKSAEMIEPGGWYVGIDVPLLSSRADYLSGALWSHNARYNRIKGMKKRVSLLLKRDTLGYWHRPHEFTAWADKGFSVQFFGAMFHPYRFSVAMQKLY